MENKITPSQDEKPKNHTLYRKTKSFYLQEPYVYLINPSLLPNNISIINSFPVGQILPKFVKKMKEADDSLDFHVLGNILSSSVKIHKSKIDLVIKHQLRSEVQVQKKRQVRQFDPSKTLAYWYNRPQLILASDEQKQTFFEELLIAFEEIQQFEISQEKKKKKIDKKGITDQEKKPKRKRRKLTADALSRFDYIMNFDLTEVDAMIREMIEIIFMLQANKDSRILTKLLKPRGDEEVSFDHVVKIRIKRIEQKKNLKFDVEKTQLERVRSLLSLLYLLQDGYVEAWQDEETFQIDVKPLKKAKELID
ncbi:MAG: hypothetical protein ACXAC7_05360 [Candidatus Hodarchaeales archaeon]|jgi:hypothetical protein